MYDNRFSRVEQYLLKAGFVVGRGIYSDPPHADIPTVDVHFPGDHFSHSWCPYDPKDTREKVWALIIAARGSIDKHEKTATHTEN